MDKVNPISSIDYIKIHEVLSSSSLTNRQKVEFIKKNEGQIKSTLKLEITKDEFKQMMANRPLIRFRPLKNSFTKRGDDIILAQSLGIDTTDIRKYINSIIDMNFDIQTDADKGKIDKLRTYVYRHGTKEQVVAFLDNELSDVKNVLKILYKTLDDNSGGVADYFMRPIHRMDNNTMRRVYNTIDKSLKASADAGYMDEAKLKETSEWALVRIYQIQNNSRVLRACKLYDELNG